MAGSSTARPPETFGFTMHNGRTLKGEGFLTFLQLVDGSVRALRDFVRSSPRHLLIALARRLLDGCQSQFAFPLGGHAGAFPRRAWRPSMHRSKCDRSFCNSSPNVGTIGPSLCTQRIAHGSTCTPLSHRGEAQAAQCRLPTSTA